ncbi:hypothetical protein NX86_06910 [Streptococcus phocae subsp. salmonis]|nr:hypothetical protein NX86_06910 [Streptococcus phocae subsp. salmonis]
MDGIIINYSSLPKAAFKACAFDKKSLYLFIAPFRDILQVLIYNVLQQKKKILDCMGSYQ